jgi:hypothetical protein
MQIKIRENAFVSTCGFNPRSKAYAEFIKENGGKWIDVETEHLFNNQYNTEHFRVMDMEVEAVREDARIGSGKCKYCGKMVREGEECHKHEECEKYGIEWFTEVNTFFIKFPNGVPAVKPFPFKNGYDCRELPMFGTFRLEHLNGSLNYYRLKNARQKFEFLYADGLFIMRNGTPKKHLGITAMSFKESELKAYLEAQNKAK